MATLVAAARPRQGPTLADRLTAGVFPGLTCGLATGPPMALGPAHSLRPDPREGCEVALASDSLVSGQIDGAKGAAPGAVAGIGIRAPSPLNRCHLRDGRRGTIEIGDAARDRLSGKTARFQRPLFLASNRSRLLVMTLMNWPSGKGFDCER
jgi:hypothetical protein